MIRRCIWKLSSVEAIGRRHGITGAHTPFYLSSRHEHSTSTPKKPTQKPSPEVETSGSTINASKLILGSVVVGAAVLAVYQTGYFKLHVKDDNSSLRTINVDTVKVSTDSKHPADKVIFPNNEIQSQVTPNAGNVEIREGNNVDDLKMNTEISVIGPIKAESVPFKEERISISVDNATIPSGENAKSVEGSSEQIQSKDNCVTDIKPNQEASMKTEVPMEEKEDFVGRPLHHSKETDVKVADSYQETLPGRPLYHSTETDVKVADSYQETLPQVLKDSVRTEGKSLEDSYSLISDEGSSKDHGKLKEADAVATFLEDKEPFVASSDNKKLDDANFVLDFIEAIHAAERKQAESDAYTFMEEKRKIKEKFEKELKDARARELMYAEEAAILEKELNKEKAKAAATIKSIQEQAEQKLKEELQRKEEEVDVQLRKAQELCKAELAAAIAKEKSSQLEKIAEANLHINSLCMAFYARSEEARQTHSVHKLALGTLALEDALSKGLPIRTEVDVLYKSLEGIDRGSLLALALSSLPDDTVNHGIDTPLQLNQKFDSLKATLRHFCLIPTGGGGLLAHAVAHIASSIKMIEYGSSDSIESLISRIDSFITEKKYAEAADALEEGVRGTEAEVAAVGWSRQARKRAVAEQALSLLQSFALSITFE